MSPAGENYLKWYYETQVWKRLSYRGVRILKNALDLWNYQEILHEHGIEWVIETGTRHGGSTLYFADILKASDAPGLVISVDADHTALQIGESDRIRLLKGDSASAATLAAIAALLPADRGPAFVILDSDHSRDHVLKELRAYVPLMKTGDYLVVEDTCVNGHPVRPDFGPGPMEAVETYLRECPGLLERDVEREEKFSCTFAPGGHFIRR